MVKTLHDNNPIDESVGSLLKDEQTNHEENSHILDTSNDKDEGIKNDLSGVEIKFEKEMTPEKMIDFFR